MYRVQVENKEYLKDLINKLDAELVEINAEEDAIVQMIRVDKLINYIITEAISLNFSKSYLHKLAQAIFKYNPKTDFQDQWSQFKAELLELKLEEYSIIFKIRSS